MEALSKNMEDYPGPTRAEEKAYKGGDRFDKVVFGYAGLEEITGKDSSDDGTKQGQ